MISTFKFFLFFYILITSYAYHAALSVARFNFFQTEKKCNEKSSPTEKKRISLNCNCKTKDKDQKSGEPGRITPNKSVSLAWLYIQVFRLLIIPKLFQLYIISPESDFISPGFSARKSTFYRWRKKSFLPLLFHSYISTFPIEFPS